MLWCKVLCWYCVHCPGPARGGSGGTSYPGPGLGGPGLRGPGRVEVVASSFGRNFFLSCPSSIPDFRQKMGPPFFLFALHLILGKKWDQIWVKTFFLLFTKFWAKNKTQIWVKTFFIFALHLILGKNWDQIWVKTFFFALHKILGKKWDPNLSEDLFYFCSSPNFGQKLGPNLSEDLFFCSSQNFGQKMGSKFEWRPFLFLLFS